MVLSFENKKNIPKFNISDSLIVQVETEARDGKGARLTLDYSINGENLVLLPNSKNLSISKKIADLEIIKKLKDTFLSIDKGLILRTKSVEKSPDALLEEYKKLEAIDNQIKKDFKEKNTTLLYDNNSILKKALTLLDEDIDEFIINDEDSFNKIKNTLEDYKILFDNKNIKLSTTIEEDISIFANEALIMRMIDNLLSNALKYVETEVTVCLARRNRIILEVADDGIGISDNEKKLIWDRFYKVDKSRTTTEDNSSGLGLSITKKIVELHDGKIAVLDNKPKGTRFVVNL